MGDLSGVGKMIILMGVLVILLGVILTVLPKLPSLSGGFGWLGKLPGDIVIKRENFTLYFPLATSLVLSVVVSLLLFFLSKR